MTDYDLYRDQLAELTGDELVARCVIEKRIARYYRDGGSVLLDLCWSECCRRKHPDLFTRALEQVREEIRQSQAHNQRATEELCP